ncbi:EAL domain-containing protein [Roseateles chitinivorans]|uniref:putative bifunctional diguanylate cyclase/phosphodiesterase n=1 Tax=Roseateles chitinivorans TaxID=2917965 RepID=UPI003D667B23
MDRGRHPGHRPRRPDPQLQPAAGVAVGHSRRPPQRPQRRRRAGVDAAQCRRRRVVCDAAGRDPGIAAAAHQRQPQADRRPRARTRLPAAVEPGPTDRPRVLVPRPQREAGRAPAHRGAVAQRHAHRAAEPARAHGARGLCAGDGPPRDDAVRAAQRRPRPLQADQRHAGPLVRGPRAEEVALRLKESLREVDTVARLDGDEFALLIHQADARGAEHAARRVQEAMSRPFCFDTLSFTVTCSIGIALFPGDGASAEELLASAERAMHWVKESGRSAFRFHQPRKDVDLLSRMRLDHAMRQALQEHEFRLHFQPQVSLETGELVGAEALIRWRDPLRGDVPPSEFIPVAEESGFIVAIGQWVLQQAVAQAAAWLQKGLRVPVAVNVSALQFQQTQFVEQVAQALRAYDLPPSLLELELTESVLLRDAEEALHRMEALSELGVLMSIDDFGTGYSSLGYLKRFPIQRLKIDRSFVQGLPGDASDAGIVNAIVQMGRALNLKVIAEGVETDAQRDFLARCGCHEYQGFLCAPALETRAFEERQAQIAAQAEAAKLAREQAAAAPRTARASVHLLRGT